MFFGASGLVGWEKETGVEKREGFVEKSHLFHQLYKA